MRFTIKILSTLVAILLITVPAHADQCVAGPMSGMAGTTCTIGDMDFIFGATTFLIRTNGVIQEQSIGYVWFSPDATPLNPGFSLFGNFSIVSNTGYGIPDFSNGETRLTFQLPLGVRPLLPDT